METGAADVLILNAKVIKLDRNFNLAGGIAVKNGRIQCVGDILEVKQFRGPKTEVFDLGGRTVLPGIQDAHIHASLLGGTLEPVAVDISSAKSSTDVVRSIGDKATTLKPGEWVRGIGLDSFASSKARGGQELLPTRWDLDQVSEQNPVYVGVAPFHGDRKVLLNSLALKMTSLNKDSKAAPGGEVVKDPRSGDPTGLLIGAPAEDMVKGILPPLTRAEKRQAIYAVNQKLNSLGITSITEPSLGPGAKGFLDGLWDEEVLDLYKEMAEQGMLNLRVSVLLLFTSYGAFLPKETRDGLSSISSDSVFHNSHLRVGGIKLYADGIPPARTAWMSEDYPGGGNGRLVFPGKDDSERCQALEDIVDLAHRQGFQVGIHATGDRSISACIDSFIKAETKNPKGLRHYIIHGDLVSAADAKRMAKWGLGISVQPALASAFAPFMRYTLGPEKANTVLPLRTLIGENVHVAAGSDSPVMSPDWRLGLQSAILKDAGEGDGRQLSPPVGLPEALRMYTLEGAWQDHQEKSRGSIEVGKLADFCILDGDLLRADPSRITEIPIFMTIIGGEIVYTAGD
jgi:predicted amidohydrolase YtcJ